jgi:DNA-binding transcriptional regulator YhcF (GntR family)
LNIPDDNLDNKKIIEIVNGFLTIVDKLQDNGVKSIKTAEFKTWTDKIIEDGKNNSKKVNDLGNYIKNLPDDIDRTNSNSSIQELYKLIKNG